MYCNSKAPTDIYIYMKPWDLTCSKNGSGGRGDNGFQPKYIYVKL